MAWCCIGLKQRKESLACTLSSASIVKGSIKPTATEWTWRHRFNKEWHAKKYQELSICLVVGEESI